MTSKWGLYAQGVLVLAAVIVLVMLARWATIGW